MSRNERGAEEPVRSRGGDGGICSGKDDFVDHPAPRYKPCGSRRMGATWPALGPSPPTLRTSLPRADVVPRMRGVNAVWRLPARIDREHKDEPATASPTADKLAMEVEFGAFGAA